MYSDIPFHQINISDHICVDDFSFGDQQWFERNIYGIGGRYVAIIDFGKTRRIYLDPSGSLPVVYDPVAGLAASSSSLLSSNIDCDLLSGLGMPGSGLYIPFGLTAHIGIKRLLPNHYLDLSTMTSVRHWPIENSLAESSLERASSLIADNLSNTVRAVINKKPVCGPLTAGRFSRMLLAACKPYLTEIEFITVRSSAEDIDSHVARQLGEKFSLDHRFIYRTKSDERALGRWQEDVGYCVSGMA
jgi:asparagine synthetase B (glutamine-hydrolysing)